MDNPLTAMAILTAGTGSWFSSLSDTKKGIMALLSAIVMGFAIGTTTVSQVGLPKRVEALETVISTHETGLSDRVKVLEDVGEVAQRERDYILKALQWQNCAWEARDDELDLRTTCGARPEYGFGRFF